MTRHFPGIRTAVFALLALALLGGPALAGNPPKTDQPTNEIEGKAPHEYLLLPRMGIAVPDETSPTMRELQLEVWIYVPDPDKLQKMNAVRTVIAADIKAELGKIPAKTFLSEDGPKVVKDTCMAMVEKVAGKDMAQDVLIRKMLLR